jgi:AcrR family transcriptional regulator
LDTDWYLNGAATTIGGPWSLLESLRVVRLSREESRAQTRAKLLASARQVVAREGYENASVGRIAEEAGFSKGAFYSNFASKEEIVLELLETHSLQDVEEISAALQGVTTPAGVIDVVSAWSRVRSSDPMWGLLTLELVRRARRNETFSERHANLFRAQWRGLGEILLTLFPPGQAPADAETLGGVVIELTYAPASGFKTGPKAGEMVHLVLTGLVQAYGTAKR